MYRFLRSPKWLLGHALVAAVLVTFPVLGVWQLDRHAEVSARNAAVEARLAEGPRPLAAVLEDGPPDYALVTAEGRWVADAQVLTSPRSREGQPGHHVLTPLETDSAAVLVDRGWVPFERDGVPEEHVAPPEGEVRVEGLLVPAEGGDPGEGEHPVAITPAAVEASGLVDGSYVQLRAADPEQVGPLPPEPPVEEGGNHLSYAVQWFVFTAIVAVGYPLLVWRTARDRRGSTPPAGGDPAPRPVDAATAR